MSEVQQTGTALAVLPLASLPTLIAADENDILGNLARELAGYEPDASTPAGRVKINAVKKMIGTAKMDFVRLAETVTEGARKTVNSVRAERKIIEDRMDEMRDQIGQPLVEYQAREQSRIDEHERLIAKVEGAASFDDSWQGDIRPDDIDGRIEWLGNLDNVDWQEFSRRGRAAVAASIATLHRLRAEIVRKSEETAELSRLRAEQAEHDRLAAIEAQRVREEQIARDAAEAARVATEAEAARQAEEARAAAQAALDAAEALRARQADEAARKQAEAAEALENAERERLAGIEREKAAAEKIERDRIDGHRTALEAITEHPLWGKTESSADIARRGRYLLSIERDWEEFADEAKALIETEAARTRTLLDAAMARESEQLNAQRLAAAAQAEHDSKVAVEAERRRVAQAAAAQKAKDEARAADEDHRKTIQLEIVADLMQHCQWPEGTPLVEALARKIVTAVATGKIRNMKIGY